MQSHPKKWGCARYLCDSETQATARVVADGLGVSFYFFKRRDLWQELQA